MYACHWQMTSALRTSGASAFGLGERERRSKQPGPGPQTYAAESCTTTAAGVPAALVALQSLFMALWVYCLCDVCV